MQLPVEQRPMGPYRYVEEEDVEEHLLKKAQEDGKPENPFQSNNWATKSELKAVETKSKQYTAMCIKYREKLETKVEVLEQLSSKLESENADLSERLQDQEELVQAMQAVVLKQAAEIFKLQQSAEGQDKNAKNKSSN